MENKMKAILLEKINKAVMKEIPVPSCGKGEILIRTKAATVCTSDILVMRHNLFNLTLPLVMGHESAGVITAIGEGVSGLAIGDEVAVHPVMPCRKCTSCLRGLDHLCDEMEELGFTRAGVFAEYFVTRPDRVRKKPSEISFSLAALIEPVCVCLEAINRAKVKSGDNILVVGDGPFGIMVSKLCVSRHPNMIIHTGRYDERLKYIEGNHNNGTDIKIINEKKTPDMVGKIMELTGNTGVDSAILCVSNPNAVDLCIDVLRSRGILAVFAALKEKTPVDLLRVHIKELTITGANNDENLMDDAVGLLTAPELNLNSIITHEIPFEKWEEAFNLVENSKDSCLKVSLIF